MEVTANNDHDLLIEVNTNVKHLANTLNGYTSAANATSNDHEARLRVVEAENQQLKGAQKSQRNLITVVSVVGGLIGTALTVVQFLR